MRIILRTHSQGQFSFRYRRGTETVERVGREKQNKQKNKNLQARKITNLNLHILEKMRKANSSCLRCEMSSYQLSYGNENEKTNLKSLIKRI